ncbi:MAG TPA: response regulator [Gemmatimonadales bacterium]|jgi:DNA-binding NtrC family response regulator|nr:response regulator [Gemmatimonadales bacterium]
MIRILLVDDDDLSRGAVHRMLERAGYSVHSTGNGSEAIVRYKADKTDLVITDLIMPETDGLEIIQELRRVDPAVRILAISGGGRVDAEEYLSVARKFGAIEVLPKPFTGQELKRAVERALAHQAG